MPAVAPVAPTADLAVPALYHDNLPILRMGRKSAPARKTAEEGGTPPADAPPEAETIADADADSLHATLSLENIPHDLREKFEIHEWRHASAILQHDFPDEWKDIVEVLSAFRLLKSEILAKGGRKTKVADRLDKPLYAKGWTEKKFDTKVVIDSAELKSPTHKVDCLKNRVALEVEWNNKDPFFDRDLNNFRLLFDLRAISVGVIVTRCDELQGLFNELNKGASYGQSTTHMSRLLPRIEGGGGGGCPILVFGIRRNLYEDDAPGVSTAAGDDDAETGDEEDDA